MKSNCPFCGSDRVVTGTVSNTGGNLKFDWCRDCHAQGPTYNPHKFQPFEKWNTRATQPESEDGKRLDWLESCEEVPTRDIYGRDYRTAIPMQTYLNRKAIDAAMHSTESKGA